MENNTAKEIKIDDYNYSLPDENIAKFPLKERDKSKLLVYKNGHIEQSYFENIAGYIPPKSLMVFNNTRVIQARIIFAKPTGGLVEIFCLEPLFPNDYQLVFQQQTSCVWKCLVGNLKKWKDNLLQKDYVINGTKTILIAEKMEAIGNTLHIRFSWNNPTLTFADILDTFGELPIPPYLNRKTEESDKQTYQTIYSKIKGSVAAPTAGLHFTEREFASLKASDISFCELTLHVGAGTFQPVKSEQIGDHLMHTEIITVQKETIQAVQKNLGHIVAVGTTSVRTLESLYYIGLHLSKNNSVLSVSQWEPYQKQEKTTSFQSLGFILDYLELNHLEALTCSTQIIIVPGYDFKIVNAMVTNFHQPKSTLLLLVSAFVKGNWKEIYSFALSNNFRFLSYGDSSLLFHD